MEEAGAWRLLRLEVGLLNSEDVHECHQGKNDHRHHRRGTRRVDAGSIAAAKRRASISVPLLGPVLQVRNAADETRASSQQRPAHSQRHKCQQQECSRCKNEQPRIEPHCMGERYPPQRCQKAGDSNRDSRYKIESTIESDRGETVAHLYFAAQRRDSD